jgi:hypothetical protein
VSALEKRQKLITTLKTAWSFDRAWKLGVLLALIVIAINTSTLAHKSKFLTGVSIESVSGNIPVAIKDPMAANGSICANPCR